jgi:hypothetical protein
MKSWCRLCVTAVITLMVSTASAQTDSLYDKHVLDVSGNMVFRGEYRSGGLSNDDEEENGMQAETSDHAGFVMSKIIMNIDYKYKNLSVRVAPRYVGVWGQAGGGSFNIYEGWVKMQDSKGLFFQLGRQVLNYDDQRIIGADDWTMMALSHDVLKVGYEGPVHKVHAFVGFNQNGEKFTGGSYYVDGYRPYKHMETVWYHLDVPGVPLGVSLLGMNVGMQNTNVAQRTENQQLFGGYVNFHPENLTVEGSYYRQTGHDESSLPISAWMASGKISYRPSAMWNLMAGYDFLSGDELYYVPAHGRLGLTRHETIHGFSPIFGAHHQFYGAMDFFYIQNYYYGFTPGLQNLYFGGTYAPTPKVKLNASYHYMATAIKLKDVGKTLGHEVELGASYKMSDMATLSAGYTLMFGSDTMKRLKRTGDSQRLNWAWLMLQVSPEFLHFKF